MGHESELDWRKRLRASGEQPTLARALALQLALEQLSGETPTGVCAPVRYRRRRPDERQPRHCSAAVHA